MTKQSEEFKKRLWVGTVNIRIQKPEIVDFLCESCESKITKPISEIENIPKTCPYCGEDKITLDKPIWSKELDAVNNQVFPIDTVKNPIGISNNGKHLVFRYFYPAPKRPHTINLEWFIIDGEEDFMEECNKNGLNIIKI